MEITINETDKTIKFHGTVKINELMDFLNKLNLNFNEYSLIPDVIIQYYYYTSPPCTPYYTNTPWVTYTTGTQPVINPVMTSIS